MAAKQIQNDAVVTNDPPAATVLQSDDTSMTLRSLIDKTVQQEDINFLLTNRIPRRLADACSWAG